MHDPSKICTEMKLTYFDSTKSFHSPKKNLKKSLHSDFSYLNLKKATFTKNNGKIQLIGNVSQEFQTHFTPSGNGST